MRTLIESILDDNLESNIKHAVEDVELFKHRVKVDDIGRYNDTFVKLNDCIDFKKK